MAVLVNPKNNVLCCHFCNGNHLAKNCKKETMDAPLLKKTVGRMMEYWIANTFNCPSCNLHMLYVINNNTPSTDIICRNCSNIFEVKSKCLSIKILPDDILLNNGKYDDFIRKINKNLSMFVVIYGADRITKNITIKEVLYIKSNDFKNKDNITIKKCCDSCLSTISIKNRNKLTKLPINNETIHVSVN